MGKDMFEQVEKAWSMDSDDYNNSIQRQLINQKDVEHWQDELKTVLEEKPLRLLDVGCGPGFFAVMLARLGHNVTAVDAAAGMVEFARRNTEREGFNVRVYPGDAVLLKGEEAESFDAIISRDVVWTLYDPGLAFRRWNTLLKKDGKVIIYDGNYRLDQSSLRYYILKLISNTITLFTEGTWQRKRYHGTVGNGFEQLPMIKHKRPQKDFELLQQAGFEKIEILNDRFRNSPGRFEFWKYGYQGKKFRIIAYKQGW